MMKASTPISISPPAIPKIPDMAAVTNTAMRRIAIMPALIRRPRRAIHRVPDAAKPKNHV